MKILITTDWYKPVVNGVVTSVLNLKSELEKAGHQVKVLTLSQTGKPYYEDGAYYLRSFKVKIYPQARATYSFRSHFLPEILKWKPDVIHSQCEWASFYFAKYISQKLNIPIVHTYHTIYEDYTHYLPRGIRLGKKLVLMGTNHVVNKTDYVITPTDKARKLLLSYGIENPIVTIPTGISLDKYGVRLTAERRDVLRKKYGIADGRKLLVTVGRLGKEKNVDELIDDMAVLVRKRPEYTLLIVGGGPYKEELVQRVKNLQMEEHIVFTGMVPPSEVHEYFKLGQVFLCASQSEAQGLTYIEALASGVPLLCKDDDCLEGVLTDGYNGFRFKDSRQFCDRLEEIVGNENKYREMCLNASFSADRFSKENFGHQLEKVYRAAVETFPGHTGSRFRRLTKLVRKR